MPAAAAAGDTTPAAGPGPAPPPPGDGSTRACCERLFCRPVRKGMLDCVGLRQRLESASARSGPDEEASREDDAAGARERRRPADPALGGGLCWALALSLSYCSLLSSPWLAAVCSALLGRSQSGKATRANLVSYYVVARDKGQEGSKASGGLFVRANGEPERREAASLLLRAGGQRERRWGWRGTDSSVGRDWSGWGDPFSDALTLTGSLQSLTHTHHTFSLSCFSPPELHVPSTQLAPKIPRH